MAEGVPLEAEGVPLVAEGVPLVAEGVQLMAEGVQLVTEGVPLVAEGVPLVAEGVERPAEGNGIANGGVHNPYSDKFLDARFEKGGGCFAGKLFELFNQVALVVEVETGNQVEPIHLRLLPDGLHHGLKPHHAGIEFGIQPHVMLKFALKLLVGVVRATQFADGFQS